MYHRELIQIIQSTSNWYSIRWPQKKKHSGNNSLPSGAWFFIFELLYRCIIKYGTLFFMQHIYFYIYIHESPWIFFSSTIIFCFKPFFLFLFGGMVESIFYRLMESWVSDYELSIVHQLNFKVASLKRRIRVWDFTSFISQ